MAGDPLLLIPVMNEKSPQSGELPQQELQLLLIGQCTHYQRTPWTRSGSGLQRGGFAPAPPGFNALVPLPIAASSSK
jgi:hypothetical protein